MEKTRNYCSVNSANSIPHATTGRFGAARLILRPSAPGSGVIAGGSIELS